MKNETIIKEFEKLINQIKFDIDTSASKSESMVNHYRLRQVNNVLNILKKYPKEIKSSEQLKGIKGVGKNSLARISEILTTGKLSEIKIKGSEKKYLDIIEQLEQIIGIGRKTALDLVKNHDIKSIDQLKEAYNNGTLELTNQQVLGLKYYDLLKDKIPRAEIDKIYNYILSVAVSIDPELLIIICGSYRRLKPFSNDVDILISHPRIKTKLDIQKNPSYLIALRDDLKKRGFLLDDLTDKDPEIKYMGFCQYKENNKIYPVRRIDMRYIPYDSYYPALLYFTGSGEFNRKMRDLARNLDYLLNEYGLYKLQGNKKIRIKINSEKDIFDELGMEYIEPQFRE